MEGILNLCKPAGPTSHDVVARVRRLLGVRRVGHAGTLDPAATGVLVLFLGSATRLIEFAVAAEKEYLADVCFGKATTTLDADGDVTLTADASRLTRQELLAALPRFTGRVWQVPPMHSAVHHQGRRLYELARRGEEVPREPRAVTIYQLELLDFAAGPLARARLRVVCSPGTYVRALAADLGEALGLPAHLEALARTRVGPFRVEDAVSLETLAARVEGAGSPRAPEVLSLLAPARQAVEHLPLVVVSGEALARARHGGPFAVPDDPGANPGLVRIETPEGLLVGVGRREPGPQGWVVRPTKVLLPA